jgi:RNA polymerase sigma-70 factor, ECF subfamily
MRDCAETAEEEAEAWGEDLADVEAARAGDREAFARLYRAFGPMVHAIVLARVSEVDVADLVQDVFVTALHRLPTLRDAAAFGGWLAAIARNRATDHARRRDPTADADAHELAARSIPGEAFAALRAIRSLPEAYRETITMRLVEGMAGPEIARRTGLTPGSVRVNLHRGMKLLRKRLGDGGDHG